MLLHVRNVLDATQLAHFRGKLDGAAWLDGRVTAVHRFRPDRSYVEETILPSVRAPHEGASCLKRLAAIALAA